MIITLQSKDARFTYSTDFEPFCPIENGTVELPEIMIWHDRYHVLRGVVYNDHANRYELRYEEAMSYAI